MKLSIRILAVLWLFMLVAAPAAAEQLTTVAILDVSRVYSSFLRDSQAVRSLERAAEEAREEIRGHEQELAELQEDLLEAQDEEDERAELRIENRIQEKRQFIEELRRVRSQQLERQQQNLMVSDSFLNEIQQAIRYVSESGGYTVVMNASDPNLQWWSTEVDITDEVIERLRQSRR